ncbi:MAG: hypothetical protein IPO88_11645 [Nannocystis sp.]|uniref:kelch repeat-containing protein n=1 Tax=Nannocystis sp. TaxID=1962667 RepID=UPI0024267F2D|nr:kelch repeat-containing protein [Nannocystis sp.]MBK9754140.1 hypothetical protein [Nannocystis sp.]
MMGRSGAWLVLAALIGCGDGPAGVVTYEYQGVIRPADPAPEERWGHVASPLLDGRILISGGIGPAVPGTLEQVYPTELWLFDPETGSFSRSRAELSLGRFLHAAVVQPNGRVVIAGGAHYWTPPDGDMLTVDIYDPGSDEVVPGAEALAPARQVAALPDGDLVGFNFGPKEDQIVVQRYRVEEGRWVRLAGVPEHRFAYPTVVGVSGSEILVLGALGKLSSGGIGPVDVFERYDPAAGPLLRRRLDRRHGDGVSPAAVLADGQVLVLTTRSARASARCASLRSDDGKLCLVRCGRLPRLGYGDRPAGRRPGPARRRPVGFVGECPRRADVRA